MLGPPASAFLARDLHVARTSVVLGHNCMYMPQRCQLVKEFRFEFRFEQDL